MFLKESARAVPFDVVTKAEMAATELYILMQHTAGREHVNHLDNLVKAAILFKRCCVGHPTTRVRGLWPQAIWNFEQALNDTKFDNAFITMSMFTTRVMCRARLHGMASVFDVLPPCIFNALMREVKRVRAHACCCY